MPNQISNIRKRIKEVEDKDKETPKESPLDGDDIMEILGIPKGPIVGKIKEILGNIYLDNPYLTKEELADIVRDVYKDLK